MQTKKYIYSFNYDTTEKDLCRLESRYLFDVEEENKLVFSDMKIEPSVSAFIKRRLDVISFSDDYETLIRNIKKENICIDGFKVEYLVFHGDTTEYSTRLRKLKDVGFSINGMPDYHKPIITYTLCFYEGIWYFSLSVRNNLAWHKHKQKPSSYSNSITINIAKALVNIAAKDNPEKTMLDACCGVGTIMLEACFAGYNIEGCDINPKIFVGVQQNLTFFNYTAKLYNCDIKEVHGTYGAAIIDLPYNLYSRATEEDIINIIESTAKTSDKLVIVSCADITSLIINAGFRISDHCKVPKIGKKYFSRKIWVCDKNL